jgi:uncharacterized protein
MKMIEKVVGMSIFVALLALCTWLSTEVYITALNIGTHGTNIIHTATIVFWLLFLFSFFSDEMVSGAHIRFIYRTCNIIFGVMFYLFLGSIFLSILLAFVTVTKAVAVGIIVLSFICSIVGLVQARNIVTTDYEVSIPNLPLSWQGKKGVFLSDTHFGLMNHKNFSNKIVGRILSINPSFVFHGGDFYDGPKVSMAPITKSWQNLTNKIPVFYTSGNHEMYGPYQKFIDSIKNAGVTVLLDEKTVHEGVQIVGITYRHKGEDIEIQKVLESIGTDPSLPLILINHAPTFHKAAINSGTDLMLSGHTHRGQFSPIGLLTRIIYKKYNYGFHITENMTAITSRGVGTAGPPMRLFNAPELVIITFKNKV